MSVRIHFLDMPPAEAIEAKIGARVARLARFSDGIQNCEVWLQSPHGHHRRGPLYGLRIRLTVPGEEIVIEHQPETDDVYVAIREAFDAARRQLEDYERRRRGQLKAHPGAPGDASRRRRVLTDWERESKREMPASVDRTAASLERETIGRLS